MERPVLTFNAYIDHPPGKEGFSLAIFEFDENSGTVRIILKNEERVYLKEDYNVKLVNIGRYVNLSYKAGGARLSGIDLAFRLMTPDGEYTISESDFHGKTDAMPVITAITGRSEFVGEKMKFWGWWTILDLFAVSLVVSQILGGIIGDFGYILGIIGGLFGGLVIFENYSKSKVKTVICNSTRQI